MAFNTSTMALFSIIMPANYNDSISSMVYDIGALPSRKIIMHIAFYCARVKYYTDKIKTEPCKLTAALYI